MKIKFFFNIDQYSKFIFQYRVVIILIVSILTVTSLFFIPKLKVKNDSAKFSLNRNDPVIKSQEFFDSLFGSNEYVYLLIETDSANNKNILASIHAITDMIRDIKGVKSVFSLTDAEKIEWIPFLNILIPTPVPIFKNKTEQIDLDSLQKIFKNSNIYFDNVVTKDFTRFNVIINLEKKTDDEGYEKKLDSLIENINKIFLLYSESRLRFYLAGAPLIDKELSNIVKEDLKLFVPLSILISILVLFFAVRKIFYIIISMVVSSVSLIWSLAVISISNTEMSVGLSVIIPLILVINIAYSLYYIYHHQSVISLQSDKIDILNKSIEIVLIPSLLAGLTTAIGFFSLMTSDFKGIQEIGAFIGIGILFSMFSTNLLLPILLSFKQILQPRKKTLLMSLLQKMYEFTISHYRLITLSFLMVFVAALYGISRIKMDTNILNYIDQDYQIRKSFNKIDSVFGGTLPLEILVTSNFENVEKNIILIDTLSAKIRNDKLIGSTISIVDILKFIDSSRPIEDPNILIPFSFTEKKFPAAIWNVISKSDIGSNFVSIKDTCIYFRISCRVKSVGSDKLKSLLDRLELHKINGKNNKIITTGLVPFFIESNNYIMNSQISSFSTAFISILFFFLIFTRSIRLGLIALIPNIFPIIFTIGLLGIIDIPLDLSNIMIASIAIGIIGNDTIHFLYNYSKDKNSTAVQNIRSVYNSISSPIFSTSIIVAAGFFILSFSNFVPTKYFGILAGVLVIVALLSDLLLLPALLLLFEKPKTLMNGKHEARSI